VTIKIASLPHVHNIEVDTLFVIYTTGVRHLKDNNQKIDMGKKSNNKALEKKAEKKAEKERKNAAVANVKLANSVKDPLDILPKPFSVYNKNGLDLVLETVRAPDMDEATLSWAFEQVKTNMKPLYDEVYKSCQELDWEDKKEEMREDLAWYLLVRNQEGAPVAFSHFRYDLDYGDEVLYCYQIQVQLEYRRKGLGKFMMKVLEMLMIKADMLKIMCTIFKNDISQFEFFVGTLKFEVDETSFMDTVDEQSEFKILSRFNQIKKRKMQEEGIFQPKVKPSCCTSVSSCC